MTAALTPPAAPHRHRRAPWRRGWTVVAMGSLVLSGLLGGSGCTVKPSASDSPAPPATEAAVIPPAPPPKPPVPADPPAPPAPKPATEAPTSLTPRPAPTAKTAAAPTPPTVSAPSQAQRSQAQVRTVALPPVPAAPPEDAAGRAVLLSRPPLAPPVPAALLVPAGDTPADARCAEAARAARTAVLSALSVPRDALTSGEWVEPILKVTELALVACRGDAPPGDTVTTTPPPPATQAATYWRATAFLLHGQYARAAVHYRRTAEMAGAYAWLGYSRQLADILDACAKTHRPALDAWRLAGLLESRGDAETARRLYGEAANSGCRPLSKVAEVRGR